MASIKFLNEYELISCGINDHTIKLWDIRKFRDYRDAKLILKSPTDRGFTSLGSLNNSIYASCLDGSVYEFGLNQTQELDFILIMDDRTEPNNCIGTNWYGGTRFWYDIIWFGSWYEVIWFGSWFVILVRNFGSILFGSVNGTKFWYETQWFGSCSDFWFVISGPVRNGSVRFVIFKKIDFSDRTDYEPTNLVRNRFGPIF